MGVVEERLWEGALAASAARPTRPAALEEHTSEDRGLRHWRQEKPQKEMRAGRGVQVSRDLEDPRLEIKSRVSGGCDCRSSFLSIFEDHNQQNQKGVFKSKIYGPCIFISTDTSSPMDQLCLFLPTVFHCPASSAVLVEVCVCV